MTNLQPILSQKLTAALEEPLRPLTSRDVRLPQVPGKALAVIGVRRAGKTSWLRNRLAELLRAGRPRESLILLGLEDDRLPGMQVADLNWILEEYYRRIPSQRESGLLTLCLDEIQVVSGWERFVRRVLDTERIEILLSGSSARLLSREVATSLRGRGLELLIHPFSFRETLRHAGAEPSQSWRPASAERSRVEHGLARYLVTGGFPEAQGLTDRDRIALLQSYADVMVLRDVIDRHQVSNPTALRWMQRQLLAGAGSLFSVQKFFQSLKSEGIPVGKDTLYQYLDHLEDAFLIRTVTIESRSAKRRSVNPRKAYPIDPGFIPLFSMSAEPETGSALETTVLIELERRGYQVTYVRTAEDWEVDFLARRPGERPLLIQVTLGSQDPSTMEREIRALVSAKGDHRDARLMLLTLDHVAPRIELPEDVHWMPASDWLLETGWLST